MTAKIVQLEPDTTPGHLSVEAGAWWRKLASEYGIVDAGGVALLDARGRGI